MRAIEKHWSGETVLGSIFQAMSINFLAWCIASVGTQKIFLSFPQHPRSLASTTEDKVNFVPIKLYNIEKRIKMPNSGKDVI